MDRFHIHIYKVIKKAEIDIQAESSEIALRASLKEKEVLTFKDPDCNFIATDFENTMIDNLMIKKEKDNG